MRFQLDRPPVPVNAVAVVDPDQVLNRGRASYQPVAGDVAAAGVFALRWEIAWPDGSTLTVPPGTPDVVVIGRQIAWAPRWGPRYAWWAGARSGCC